MKRILVLMSVVCYLSRDVCGPALEDEADKDPLAVLPTDDVKSQPRGRLFEGDDARRGELLVRRGPGQAGQGPASRGHPRHLAQLLHLPDGRRRRVRRLSLADHEAHLVFVIRCEWQPITSPIFIYTQRSSYFLGKLGFSDGGNLIRNRLIL